MTVAVSALVETGYAPNSETTVYTADLRTIIDRCTGYGVAVADLTIKLVASGDSAGADNVMEKKTFAIGDSYSFPGIVGHVLEPGDFISVLASVGSAVNLRISGRKVT